MAAKKKTASKLGRPTKYSKALADEICEWIAGGQSLRAYCRQKQGLALSTVTNWIVTNAAFLEQYAQARESAGYAHADAILETVQELKDKTVDAQTARAIMDGLKWAAERMAPKSHSANTKHEVTGKDGEPLPPPAVVILPAKHAGD